MMNKIRLTKMVAVAVIGLAVGPALASDPVLDQAATDVVFQERFTDPSNATVIPGGVQTMAFPGYTLNQVVDGDYKFYGYLCGGYLTPGSKVDMTNVQVHRDANGDVDLVIGCFQIGGSVTRCVVLKLTNDGKGGIVASAVKALYVEKNDPNCKFVTLSADGSISYLAGAKEVALATTYSGAGYGVCGLTMHRSRAVESEREVESVFGYRNPLSAQYSKMVPITPELAFPDLTLNQLVDEDFSANGYLCGTSWPYGTKEDMTNVQVHRDANGDVDLIIGCFQVVHYSTTKCVVLKFENVTGGVAVSAVKALYVEERKEPYCKFVTLSADGSLSYLPEAKTNVDLVTAYDGKGYGVCGLSVRRRVREAHVSAETVHAARPVQKTSELAFPGFTLNRIVDEKWRLVGYGAGGWIAKSWCEVMNTSVHRDVNGDVDLMIGGFTSANDGGYTKCVVLKFENGQDGVRVSVTGARNVQGGSNKDYEFAKLDESGNITYAGTEATVAESAAAPGYGVCGLTLHRYVPAADTEIPSLISSTEFVPEVPALAFSDVTLERIVDEKWDVLGTASGDWWNGYVAKMCHVQVHRDANGKVDVLIGSFVGPASTSTRCAVLKFEQKNDGVYVSHVKSSALMGSCVPDHCFAVLNADGSVTYSSQAQDIAPVVHYGIKALKLRKPQKILVFPDPIDGPQLSLDSLQNYDFTAIMSGGFLNQRSECVRQAGYNVYPFHGLDGRVERVMVEFQVSNSKYLQCVPVEFTRGSDGIYAEALGASYLDLGVGQLGTLFLNHAGHIGGTPIAVATGGIEPGYGAYGIIATPKKLAIDLALGDSRTWTSLLDGTSVGARDSEITVRVVDEDPTLTFNTEFDQAELTVLNESSGSSVTLDKSVHCGRFVLDSLVVDAGLNATLAQGMEISGVILGKDSIAAARISPGVYELPNCPISMVDGLAGAGKVNGTLKIKGGTKLSFDVLNMNKASDRIEALAFDLSEASADNPVLLDIHVEAGVDLAKVNRMLLNSNLTQGYLSKFRLVGDVTDRSLLSIGPGGSLRLGSHGFIILIN